MYAPILVKVHNMKSHYNPVSSSFIYFMQLEEQEDKGMAELKKKKFFANVYHKAAQKSTYPGKKL